MIKEGKKVHVINDSKLRKIRYNLRSILWMEFRARRKRYYEKMSILDSKIDTGEISYKEWKKEIREIKEKDQELTFTLQAHPISCIRCKSRQNDLQQTEEGGWECYKGEHELNERGLLKPVSPFDDNLVLWGSDSPFC